MNLRLQVQAPENYKFVLRVLEHESPNYATLLDLHDCIGFPSRSNRDRSNRVVYFRDDC